METQKTTKEMKKEETKMEIDLRKVEYKILDIARKHAQRVSRIEQHCIDEEVFSIVVRTSVCQPFLYQLSREFKDKHALIMAEKQDVLIIISVRNPKYYEESLE